MTGIMVSNAHKFQANNSQAQTQTSENAATSPRLQNRAARIFKKSGWLNDISLPLLLLLAGQIAARPANAQQEVSLDNIIITAQNQFGTVSQLTIRDGVLYLLEEGCNLVMIRQLSAADISAIRALANLRIEEVGLHLQLISYAPLSDADISDFCVASDPISSFITRIRQDDSDSSNFAGMLAGALGLLLGLAGGGGGGGGGTPAPDRTAFSLSNDSQSDAEEESFALSPSASASSSSLGSLSILEGMYGEEEDKADATTGIEVEATNRDGADISTITSSDDRFIITNGEIRIKKGTVFNYEADKKSFDITLTAGGQKKILHVTLTDQIFAEDVELEFSKAKVKRDGDMVFEPIKISDDGHDKTALDAAKFILIAEDGGEDDEDISAKFMIEKTGTTDVFYQLRLKDDQNLEGVEGPVNIQILALSLSSEIDGLKGEIESLDKITKTGGASVTNSIDLDGLTIEKTLPDITLTSHKYILLKKMAGKAVFEAVTQAELNSRTGDFAVVAELYTDIEDIKDKGLIKTQLQQDSKDYFNLEVMEITLDLKDAELDETATSAADDFLGDADNDDDSVSYDEAEAAEARSVDIDGDSTTTDDRITGIDGVVIDLSATATDTQITPVKYATKSKDAADSEVITLSADAGNLAAGDKLTSIENLIGSDHDDVLIGNAVKNQLDGGEGDDHLYGGAGADTLNGEDGDDHLSGGAGDDTLLGGLGNDILVGGAGDDTLLGGDGMDVLIGGDGSDILIGEGGIDLFRLDLDDDGTDTVLGFTLGEDKIQIDTAFQDDVTLADLGLEIIESSDGLHAHIVNASDDSHIYMTIENIDHEELSITDFEII